MKALPTTWARPRARLAYVEYAYALQNKMTYTKMVNKDGKFRSNQSRPKRSNTTTTTRMTPIIPIPL